jgi:hypothetical protein
MRDMTCAAPMRALQGGSQIWPHTSNTAVQPQENELPCTGDAASGTHGTLE